MYHVYVIKSDLLNEVYIGHTHELSDRLSAHSLGHNLSTKKSDDWKLVHAEEYPTRSLAMKREEYLKSGDGRRVLKLKGVTK